MTEARQLLRFACEVYEWQHSEGRLFIHEHPRGATNWADPVMARLLKKEGIGKYFVDMCQFNLRLADGALAKKPTIIMTNSTIISKYLSRRCDGKHVHGQLKGGNKCRQAATYTAEFCEAIVEAYKLHRRKVRRERRQGSLHDRDTMDSGIHM